MRFAVYLHGALRRTNHLPNPEVLDANQVEPPSEASADLLRPVLAPVSLTTPQPRDCRLDAFAPRRPTCGFRKLPFDRAEARSLMRGQAGTTQDLACGQRSRHHDASVDTDYLSITRGRNGDGDRGKRNVPSPGAVASDAERLHALGYRARPAEPHPSRLGNLHFGMLTVQSPHIARADGDDPEPLAPALLAPRRTLMGSVEVVLHGPVVILDGLLLDRHGSLGKPGIIRACLCQLSAPLDVSGHPPSPWPPFLLLLNAEVPDIPSVRAVPQQNGFLLASGFKTVSGHANIIARATRRL